MNPSGYCERLSASFWAEPLNAVSNAAFLLAALAAFLLLRRSGRRALPVEILTGLVAVIGIGSFLFHTMPQRWTMLADVVPIQFFALGYFGLALNRFLGLRPWAAALGALAFLGACFALASGLAPLLPAGIAARPAMPASRSGCSASRSRPGCAATARARAGSLSPAWSSAPR
jgi:hypothetical protein